jgi:hypothetical protein
MNEQTRVMDGFGASVGKGLAGVVDFDANVELTLVGPDGQVKDTRRVHNTMATLGKSSIINQCAASPTQVKPGWMELGTGTGGTTKLNAYISGSRTALDSCTNTAATNAVLTMVCTFGAGVGTGAVTEAGVFSVVTQDTVAATTPMYCYSSFTVINKAAGDSLVITWTITLS